MDFHFHIRPFLVSDVESLRNLRNEVITHTHFIYENEIWSEEHAARWYADLIREERIAITADASGQFLGCCYSNFFRQVSASRGIAELSIFICGNHQKRGIGQALISEMEKLLRERGYFGMIAVIDSENLPAIRLAEGLCFHSIGVIQRAAHLRGSWRHAQLLQKML